MNRVLDVGYTLNLSGKEFIIKEIVGKGASSVTYLAEYDKTEHILKECNPLGIAMHREENGKLVADTDLGKEKFKECLERFKAGVDNQLSFRMTEDLKNPTSNIQAIYHANGTAYIDMTYFAGKTYDKVDDESLYDLFRRMKALAQIVGYYHKSGYLHLDIKPQNIYTIPETPEMVMMFDFDSIVPINLIKNIDAVISLSYTDVWAAPEQKMSKYRNQICEATDLFAIGEIIFYKLFDKHSEENDRYSFSHYEYPVKKNRFKNVNPRVFPMITELLHKTLSYSVKKRYQNVGQLISQLDEIIKLSNPKEPFLKSSYSEPLEFFVGRDTEIADIHNKLQDTNLLFLSGIGGIGKSELAKQYAKKYCNDYDAVIFAPFVNNVRALITNDSVFPIYNFFQYPAETDDEYYASKLRKLKELCDEKTLVLVDNFDDAKADIEVLTSLGCKLLITTRLDFSDYNYACHKITALSDYNSILSIFNRYYTKPLNQTEMACVEKIIRYVNGHTMTVELLAKQMTAGRIRPEKMLEKLTSSGLRDSGKEKVRNGKDAKALSASSYDHIRMLFDMSGLNEDEKYILANLALIPYTGISAERFVEWCDIDGFDTVNTLVNQGWIRLDEEKDYISLHPVIADVVLSPDMFGKTEHIPLLENAVKYIGSDEFKQIDGSDRKEVIELFLGLSNNIIKGNIINKNISRYLNNMSIYGCYGYLDEAIHNIKYAIDVYTPQEIEGFDIAILYDTMGELLYNKSKFDLAEQYFLKALSLRICDYNATIVYSYNNLGSLYQKLCKYDLAEKYFFDALKIIAEFSIDNGIVAAQVYNELGLLYADQCQYDSAEKYYLKTLSIYKNLEINNNPNMAKLYNDIGSLYDDKCQYDLAEKYYLLSLSMCKDKLGENYMFISVPLNNLGLLYKRKGDYDLSQKYYLQSLNIRQKLLGNESALTATSYNNLASLYHDQYKYELARKYYIDAINIRKKIFGENHLDVANTYNNLGVLYHDQEKFDLALKYYVLSLKIRQKILGKTHPYIAESNNNLGSLYQDQGQFDLALKYFHIALKILIELNGKNHPSVASVYHNLGSLYHEISDYNLAQKCYFKSLAIKKKLYGELHSSTATTYYSMGSLYVDMNLLFKAQKCYKKAYQMFMRVYGENHPKTIKAQNALKKL